jgi:hypothetical protein
MPITDPTAVKFCNEKIRVMADSMAQNYYTAKAIVNEWNATGISSLITNDSSEVIDGSRQDGRKVITGAKATSIITRAMEIIADYEANTNAKLNTVIGVNVNGAARF